MANWTWRVRLGQIVAGLWFLLNGLTLFQVHAPDPLMAVIALAAGVLLILGV